MTDKDLLLAAINTMADCVLEIKCAKGVDAKLQAADSVMQILDNWIYETAKKHPFDCDCELCGGQAEM